MYYQVIARTQDRGTLMTETSSRQAAEFIESHYRQKHNVIWAIVNCIDNSEFERGRREGRI